MTRVTKLKVAMSGQSVGILADEGRGRIWFEYDPQWLKSGFDLSPQTLSFSTNAQLAKENLFDGLHGIFNDSLPDGWGLLLMDREFKRRFDWPREEVMPLDRLAYIGTRAMGALDYAPEFDQGAIPEEVDLWALAASSEAVLKGSEGDVLDELRLQAGSPGGARPKVTIARSESSSICLSGFRALPDGYSHWIVKFRSENDRRDMGCVEKAYSEMARLAGVRIPKTDIIEVSKGKSKEQFFATQRFDRSGKSDRRHVLSLAGFMYADFRVPCMDYEAVLGVTSLLTKNASEVERAFRLMVFNVLSHNKDDHAKNFSFIGDRDGWNLSPGFDLTFSAGMGGEHTTAILGRGNPDLDTLLNIGQKFHVHRANQIVGEVRYAVSRWKPIAAEWGVGKKTSAEIQQALSAIDKRFFQALMSPFFGESTLAGRSLEKTS